MHFQPFCINFAVYFFSFKHYLTLISAEEIVAEHFVKYTRNIEGEDYEP